jgi:hypothetical protein
MNVGVMKDLKLNLRNLHVSHTLVVLGNKLLVDVTDEGPSILKKKLKKGESAILIH